MDSNANTADVTENENTQCGLQLNYGCCPKKRRQPLPFLQRLAKPHWALLMFCCLGFAHGSVTNGMVNSILTTIEKRFGLRSAESGFIVSFNDGAAIIATAIVMHAASRSHKPLWIGWGMTSMGTGCILFALPHFIAPHYTVDTTMNGDFLCPSNTTTTTVNDVSLRNFRFLFYVASIMNGFGAAILYTLTLVYLDENVSQAKSSMYHGIYFAASAALGPATGFIATGSVLNVYTNIGEAVAIDNTHAAWVGAWWPGFVAAGVWIYVFVVPILLLPRELPGTEELRKHRGEEQFGEAQGEEAQKETSEKKNISDRFKEFLNDSLVLLKNPPFLLMSLANAMDTGTIAGLSTFVPKFIEVMYGRTPTEGALFTGGLAIGGALVGFIFGGLIVTKTGMKVKGMIKLCFTFEALGLLCAAVLLLQCPDLEFAGATTPYSNNSVLTSSTNFTSHCNAMCGCNSDVYHPVCGHNGITYFSPCFAGCVTTSNQTYSNCSCLENLPPINRTATTGNCAYSQCNNFIPFLCLFFVFTLLTFFCWTPNLQTVIRLVPSTHRTMAVGVQSLFNRLCGGFPVPIIMGRLLDLACSVWSTEQGVLSSCRRYTNHQMSLYMFLVIVIAKSLAVTCYVLAFLIYSNQKKKQKQKDENTIDTLDERL